MDPRLTAAITAMLPTADSLAWAFCLKTPPGTELDEFRSITAEALCQCAAKWEGYCQRNQFDPWSADGTAVNKFFLAYALRRMRGALADRARNVDWMSRNTRAKVKATTAARDAGAHAEAELAAATGLTVQQIREADAAQYRRPVPLEVELAATGDHGDALADETQEGNVEGQTAVNELLAAFMGAFSLLGAETRVVLSLRYHAELGISVIAKELNTSEERVRELHDAGVCAVHDALLRAAVAG